ncbi:MAG TPA: hypothetical protein VF939_28695 [Puia sp.]
MRPSALVFISFIFVSYLSGCHSSAAGPASSGTDSGAGKLPPLPMFKRNPEDRALVKKEPVAEYRVRTDDKLNESWFSVRLYETPKTLRYRVALEFEGLTGEDTIKLPDLGTVPQPAIEKGKDKYSCILGLLDNDHKFREMKMVYVTAKGQSLKITTLKHYVVTENYRLVSE